MNAIDILRAASRSVPNEDYVQLVAAVDGIAELIEAANREVDAAKRLIRLRDYGCEGFQTALLQLVYTSDQLGAALANVGGAK